MVTQIQLGNIFSSGGRQVFGGSSSGLDTEAMINALADARRLPAVKLEDTIEKNKKSSSAYGELKTILTALKDAANFLRNPPGVGNQADNVFEYRKGNISSNTSVSGESYFTATVKPGSPIQNYTVNQISQLAQAQKQQSDVFNLTATSDQVVFAAPGANQFGAGMITVNGANITLDDGDSLQEVANKFNAVKGDTGISASILQVAAGQFRLVFTATKTGLTADFDLENIATVTADPSGVLTNINITDVAGADARNAMFKIDNIDIERESNSIDDLISGVTLNLKQTTPVATELGLNIVPDTEIVKSGIINFADSYNNFRIFAAKQQETEDNGLPTEDAALFSSAALRSVIARVSTEISRAVAGIGNALDPSRLSDLGIKLSDFPGDDETPFTRNILTVDEAVLDSALETNFDAVSKVFEFDFLSDNNSLGVFRRTNGLAVTNFTLDVDTTLGTYKATYNTISGPVTIDLDATAISSGSGYLLKGQDGTVLQGMQFIYSSTANASMNVSISQGIADRLFNSIDEVLTTDTGLVANELKSLEDRNTRLQKEIDRIDEQVDKFRETLLKKFGDMEKAIASVNSILQSLDAQAQARANA